MNKKLYKLQQLGERLWIMAANTAMVAAGLGRDGRGFAIVAEETRNMANKVQYLVEQAMFEGEEIEMDSLKDTAQEIMFLALNAAFESHRLEIKGKQAAVCAEEIRNLSVMLFTEISGDIPLGTGMRPDTVIPWAKTPLTTILSDNICFILLKAGDIYIVENLINVHEVFYEIKENKNNTVIIRGNELPVINVPKFLNKISDKPVYIVLSAPWAEESQKYAVTVDSVGFLFYSPVGTPVSPPSDMPLAQYVRECWENENGEPFYFMDWVKMLG